MEELKIGDIIKQRYALVQFLGSGSFGEVWLAHDQMTGREVALKIYLSLDPAGVEEFQREYSNTADLSSPYLLTPEYFDVHNRRPFLLMKFCKNGSSSKLAGQISEDDLWAFIYDVASGLEVLHSQQDPIVHQDIKPDNILIDSNGRFLITDFGISKRLRATMRRQSKRDVSSGAMPYMAPERFDSNPRLNTASDIWSLGASIYELATGELPFSGFGGAMQRNGADIPSLPSTYSEKLNTLMQNCLSLDENSRPSISQLLKQVNHRNNSVTQNNDITSFQLTSFLLKNDIQLNIDGCITPTIVKPSFSGDFECIWYFWMVVIAFLGIIYVVGANAHVPIYGLIRQSCVLCTFIMWIVGYIAVYNWKPVGKYLMRGAIYLISIALFAVLAFLVDLTIDVLLYELRNFKWTSLFQIIGLIYVDLLLALYCFNVFHSLIIIRRGSKRYPSIWKYSGNRILPIFYEFILPIIVLILFFVVAKKYESVYVFAD